MKQMALPQQIINRLTERWAEANESQDPCRLGYELRRRRRGPCSVCTSPQEYELDREIAQLIDSVPFRRPGICPYRVIVSHLIAGLTFGPEASRARSASRPNIDPVAEIKSAQRHIHAALRATGLSLEDIEAISIRDNRDRWQPLYAILTAERALETALVVFRAQNPAKGRSPRGRIGALHNQAVTRAMALAWRQLTGRLPGKDNTKFHGLLLAATATVFGACEKQPDFEICNPHSGGSHSAGRSEQEVIRGKYFALTPGARASSVPQKESGYRAMPGGSDLGDAEGRKVLNWLTPDNSGSAMRSA